MTSVFDSTTSRSGSALPHTTTSATHTASPFFQTATETSSYEPQETLGGGYTTGSRENGLFGANGSPPLILAFLAIGLFGIAMVVVFGFRRIHTGRWDSIRTLGAAGMGTPLLGEKPKLWDLWTKGPTMPQSGPQPWEHVTPFSVMMEPDDEQMLLDGKTKGSSTATPSIPFTARARRRLHRLLQRRAPVPPEPTALLPLPTTNPGAPAASAQTDDAHLPTSADSQQTGDSETTTANPPPSLEKARALQVAVAILMPTQNLGAHGAPPRGVDSTDEDEVLEYSIGTMTIPWRRDADES